MSSQSKIFVEISEMPKLKLDITTLIKRAQNTDRLIKTIGEQMGHDCHQINCQCHLKTKNWDILANYNNVSGV